MEYLRMHIFHMLICLCYLQVILARNCRDPGFIDRSDRKASGREDQASRANHQPGDTVSYICKYGDRDIMKRLHHLKCLPSGKWSNAVPICPLTEWGRCRAEGCHCDEETQTVTCEAETFADMVKPFPSDTVKLFLTKTGRYWKETLTRGSFSDLKRLRELKISSKNVKHRINYVNLNFLRPLTALDKFTLEGKDRPLVAFDFRGDRKKSKCQKKNCYASCGEPELLNPKHGIRNSDETRTLHGFRFNGDRLDWVNGHTIVHTQTFYYTKVVHIPEGARWTIVTREYLTNDDVRGGPFIFGDNTYHECKVQLQSPGKQSDEKLVLLTHGPITIYAERISYRSMYVTDRGCHYEPGEPDIPRPSVDLSRAATICATNMAYPDPDEPRNTTRELRQVAMEMFNYLVKILSVPTSRLIPGAELALSNVMQAKGRFQSLELKSARFVPFVSTDLYETLLDELYRAGDVYRTHMSTFEAKETKMTDSMKATELMVQKSSDLVSAAKLTYQHAVDVLTVSKKSVVKMQKNFLEADKILAKRKVAFEAGIEKYKAKQAVNMFFAILKGIGSIVKGAFMLAAGNPAGVGDIITGIATIGETIAKIVMLIVKIKRMMQSNERLMEVARNMKGGMDANKVVSDYITDLDGAADLRLQIVHWDNMVNEVNELLGKGEVATIGGCAQYRLALSSLAAWGKALTRETIRQTSLVRDSLHKKETLRGLEAEKKRLAAMLKKSEGRKKLVEDIYTSVYFQAADVKMTLTETLRQYCLSYFYYQLKECRHTVRPKLSDTMFELLQKVSVAKFEAVKSLTNINGMPQPFQGIVVELADKESENCTSIEKCPVRKFKENGQLVFNLGTVEPAFSFMQRVKLDEITIELVGATTSVNDGKIFLILESSGDFQDMWGAAKYTFVSAPFVRAFAYVPRTAQIIYRGMVHDKFASFFIATSPFTTWTLTMPTTLSGGEVQVNEEADISGVTSIRLSFRGSAVAMSLGVRA